MIDTAVRRRLEAQIRYTFLEPKLLEDALTHASYGEGISRNARNDDGQFAFLGDAVVGLALAERGIAGGKGAMTVERATLANNEYLGSVAEKMGLQLLVGKGEMQNTAGARTRLASGLESVLGAVYHDAGPAHAIKVAKRLLSEGPAPADL